MSDQSRDLDFIAMMDQLRSMVKEQAKVLAAYHKELRAGGFTEDQAIALTLNYQTLTMGIRG